ncbi:hypothetical protein D3C86_1544310 [compost metagenome]
MCLVYITDLHRFPDRKSSFVRLQFIHDHFEDRRFTGTIRPDNSNNSCRRQFEVQIIIQQFISECFHDMLCIDHVISKARTVRNRNFQFHFLVLHFFRHHFVVVLNTRFVFCMAAFRVHTHPLQLAGKHFLAFGFRFFFFFQSVSFLLQPRRIISFPWNTFSTV